MRIAIQITFAMASLTFCNAMVCEMPGPFQGNYVDSVILPDYNDCLLKCQSNFECDCFSFYKNKKSCVLLNQCETLDLGKSVIFLRILQEFPSMCVIGIVLYTFVCFIFLEFVVYHIIFLYYRYLV